MFQDLRYGVRMPRTLKSFTLIAVVAMALGIGANTALSRAGDINACEVQSNDKPFIDSPRLAALAREAQAGNSAAIQQFWEDLKGKTPLIETIPDNDRFLRVTFLWRGGAEARDLDLRFVGFAPPELEQKPLSRLAETDVWFLTARLPVAARFTYGFTDPMGKKRGIADPLNPLKFGGRSLVELPGAPPQPWIRIQPDVPKGTLKPEKLSSEILKEERAVSVYTPAGYDPQGGPYGLLVLFDGQAYRGVIPTPTILDNLVASKKIHPLVALLVDNVSGATRDRDLQCSAPFADFLAKELLPWARQHYRLSIDPKQTIVGGSSFGGLSAAYCAFRYPEVFGAVLSQSSSFGYYPGWISDRDRTDSSPYGWLTRQFVTTRKLPIRFYLEAGLFETAYPKGLLAENRRMRDVLEAKGYSIVYSEFAGGHEYLNWRGSLADGLIVLAGR